MRGSDGWWRVPWTLRQSRSCRWVVCQGGPGGAAASVVPLRVAALHVDPFDRLQSLLT